MKTQMFSVSWLVYGVQLVITSRTTLADRSIEQINILPREAPSIPGASLKQSDLDYTLVDGSKVIYSDYDFIDLIPFDDLAAFGVAAKTEAEQTMQQEGLTIADQVPEDAALESAYVGHGYIYINLQPSTSAPRFINYGEWINIIETLLDYNDDWKTEIGFEGTPPADLTIIGADDVKIGWGILGYEPEPSGARAPFPVTNPPLSKVS